MPTVLGKNVETDAASTSTKYVYWRFVVAEKLPELAGSSTRFKSTSATGVSTLWSFKSTSTEPNTDPGIGLLLISLAWNEIKLFSGVEADTVSFSIVQADVVLSKGPKIWL